jgi:hypothetical protein
MYNTLHVILVSSAIAWFIGSQNLQAQSPDLPASTAEPATVAPSAEPPRLTFMDRRMAGCLAIDMQTGVELAQWAAAHARDEKVKQHAQRIAADGIALLKLLDERTDGRATQALRGEEQDDSAPRAADTAQQPNPQGDRRSKTQPRLNVLNAERVLMRMKLEIAEISAGSLRSHFESRVEGDADRYYVAGEIFRQVEMLSTLKVLKKYTSPAFGSILDGAMAVTERQLADTMTMLATLPGAKDTLPATPMPTVAEK